MTSGLRFNFSQAKQKKPTRIQTLNKAKAVGFDFHYYKNRNLADRPTTEHSFAINAFLFPLFLGLLAQS